MADHINAGDFPDGVSFEWDEQKNLANRAKHTIDFDDAIEVLRWTSSSSSIGPQQ